jgi:hypothetical protein
MSIPATRGGDQRAQRAGRRSFSSRLLDCVFSVEFNGFRREFTCNFRCHSNCLCMDSLPHLSVSLGQGAESLLYLGTLLLVLFVRNWVQLQKRVTPRVDRVSLFQQHFEIGVRNLAAMNCVVPSLSQVINHPRLLIAVHNFRNSRKPYVMVVED